MIALFNEYFKFFGNLLISPKTLNLTLFLKVYLDFFKYSSSKLNKKLISYFGLFQFSVENVYNVRYLIFFLKILLKFFRRLYTFSMSEIP